MVLLESIAIAKQKNTGGILGEYHRRIDQICERIQSNPKSIPSVKKLAKELHVSADYFCRIFKSYKGITPQTFITNCRLNHARIFFIRVEFSDLYYCGIMRV